MTYTKSLKRYKELKAQGRPVTLMTRAEMTDRFGYKG